MEAAPLSERLAHIIHKKLKPDEPSLFELLQNLKTKKEQETKQYINEDVPKWEGFSLITTQIVDKNKPNNNFQTKFPDQSIIDKKRNRFFQLIHASCAIMGIIIKKRSGFNEKSILIVQLQTLYELDSDTGFAEYDDLETLQIYANLNSFELHRDTETSQNKYELFQIGDKIRAFVKSVEYDKNKIELTLLPEEYKLNKNFPFPLGLVVQGFEQIITNKGSLNKSNDRFFVNSQYQIIYPNETTKNNNNNNNGNNLNNNNQLNFPFVDYLNKDVSFFKNSCSEEFMNQSFFIESGSSFFFQKERKSKNEISVEEKWNFLREYQDQVWTKETVSKGIQVAKQGNYKKALEYYKQALEVDPKQKDAFTAMGAAYANTGEYVLAIKEFKKALLIDPNDKNAEKYLEATKAKLEEIEEKEREKKREEERKRKEMEEKVPKKVNEKIKNLLEAENLFSNDSSHTKSKKEKKNKKEKKHKKERKEKKEKKERKEKRRKKEKGGNRESSRSTSADEKEKEKS